MPHATLPHPQSQDASSPLHLAAAFGHAAVIEALLAAGAVPGVRNALGRTPLHASAKRGDTASVSLLVAAGADANGLSLARETPLYEACVKGHLGAVQTLLAAGADASAVCEVRGAAFCQAGGESLERNGRAPFAVPAEAASCSAGGGSYGLLSPRCVALLRPRRSRCSRCTAPRWAVTSTWSRRCSTRVPKSRPGQRCGGGQALPPTRSLSPPTRRRGDSPRPCCAAAAFA